MSTPVTDNHHGPGTSRDHTEAAPDTGAVLGPLAPAEVHEMDQDHSSTSVVGPFVLGAALLAIGLVALQQTLAIKGEGFDPNGSRFFPLVVTCLWLALSLTYLLQHTIAVLRSKPGQSAEKFDQRVGLLVMVVLLVAYAYALQPLGYVISTAVFFVAAARTMGSRHVPRDVVAGIGLSLGVYLLFTHVLGVILPAGVLPL